MVSFLFQGRASILYEWYHFKKLVLLPVIISPSGLKLPETDTQNPAGGDRMEVQV